MLYRTFLSLASLAVTGTASAEPVPAKANGVQTLTTPNNITIRYKEPGKEGVCETTPGVKSYSGYVDLSPTSHTFFYFFEARHDPQNAPITLWLNGGPGSDSLIGLFEGIPFRTLCFLALPISGFDCVTCLCFLFCFRGLYYVLDGWLTTQNSARVISTRVTSRISTRIHGTKSPTCCLSRSLWEQVSVQVNKCDDLDLEEANKVVGFSYSDTQVGSLNPLTGEVEGPEYNGVQGRFPVVDASAIGTYSLPGGCRSWTQANTTIDTTNAAARATWEVLQGFLGSLPKLDSKVKSKKFNLWTESYGG